MRDGGAREAALTADYNAEMVERIARHPRLRDRSVFVGDPDDLVDDPLGPGLPTVRDWTRAHFAFAGYVTGAAPVDREAVRDELGWAPDERVCVVAVGGSGVGGPLLRRVAAAHPHAAERVPGLRTVVVTGPRIDPEAVPAPPGVEVHGYVPGLHRLLAACDVAVVQGGLTTTMELTAAGRPFLYFPLLHHFEQQRHVAHRLDRHRAGVRMDYATSTPESIGEALADALARPVEYRPVPADGARRAAAADSRDLRADPGPDLRGRSSRYQACISARMPAVFLVSPVPPHRAPHRPRRCPCPPRTAETLPGTAPRMDRHEISRLRAAAAHARRALPGPLGELAARELLAHAELGYRGAADALLPQLARQVLAMAVASPP